MCVAAASAASTFLLAVRIIASNGDSSSSLGNVSASCSAAVDAARHWAARPARYRLNVLVVDCCRCACATATPTSCMATSARAAATPTSAVATPTCTAATPTSGMVALARDANAGRVRRQVALTHAGTPLSDHSATLGLRAVFACPSVLFAYAVTSRDEGHVVAWNQLSDGDVVTFDEGEFPMDATVTVYVATVWNRWLHVSLTVVPIFGPGHLPPHTRLFPLKLALGASSPCAYR